MILYPAIDLKDGQCVRLEQGEMARATVFGDDPAAQARRFEQAGFAWLHVVDLNGAFAGRPVNDGAVRAIRQAVSLPIQLGGGIRDMAGIAYWLDEVGLARVILGTAALRQPEIVREACRAFPGRIAVGIDARGGKVAVEGWAEISDVGAMELALRYEDAGVAVIIYTDIEQDGTMKGPNVEGTARLAECLHTPVIASGGVSSLRDIQRLKAQESRGIHGVVIGRALYDGTIDPKAALRLCSAA